MASESLAALTALVDVEEAEGFVTFAARELKERVGCALRAEDWVDLRRVGGMFALSM